jgi:hypothetical protein
LSPLINLGGGAIVRVGLMYTGLEALQALNPTRNQERTIETIVIGLAIGEFYASE